MWEDAMTLKCRSRECDKEFIPYKSKMTFCSKKCLAREYYLKSKETGWRAEHTQTHTKTCQHRDCKKEFETKDARKNYCCSNCAKYESAKRTKDGNKRRYKSRVEPTKKVCESRMCDNTFMAMKYNSKYCCRACSEIERRAREYDKRLKENPNKRTNVSHIALLREKKTEGRFKIPHFSAKWLEDKWNKRQTV